MLYGGAIVNKIEVGTILVCRCHLMDAESAARDDLIQVLVFIV
jgi:hypothetical protein